MEIKRYLIPGGGRQHSQAGRQAVLLTGKRNRKKQKTTKQERNEQNRTGRERERKSEREEWDRTEHPTVLA